MPGHVLDSTAAAIAQSCPKHSLNEICTAAAFNACSTVLSACLKKCGMILITPARKEPQAGPGFRSVKFHLGWSKWRQTSAIKKETRYQT